MVITGDDWLTVKSCPAFVLYNVTLGLTWMTTLGLETRPLNCKYININVLD
jgi:hypothetical protein